MKVLATVRLAPSSAASSTRPDEPALRAFAERHAQRVQQLEEHTDELEREPLTYAEADRSLVLDDLVYHPTPIYDQRGGDPRLVAIALLGTTPGDWLWPLDALHTVGEALGEWLEAKPLNDEPPCTTSARRSRSE